MSRLGATLLRAAGPRARFLEGPGLFQQWKAPSKAAPCRQVATSSFAWRHNKTLYTVIATGLFGIGNVFYGYEIMSRARQRDVDRAERFARMEAQLKAHNY
ncbi:putative Apoptosis-inducing factor 1 mitochondrial-like protein [Naja naja]|nr:putative Apoptosis-inducing factor 1 mitochondrial-like protein [Naja naja]